VPTFFDSLHVLLAVLLDRFNNFFVPRLLLRNFCSFSKPAGYPFSGPGCRFPACKRLLTASEPALHALPYRIVQRSNKSHTDRVRPNNSAVAIVLSLGVDFNDVVVRAKDAPCSRYISFETSRLTSPRTEALSDNSPNIATPDRFRVVEPAANTPPRIWSSVTGKTSTTQGITAPVRCEVSQDPKKNCLLRQQAIPFPQWIEKTSLVVQTSK
jgi:hypothetical protein